MNEHSSYSRKINGNEEMFKLDGFSNEIAKLGLYDEEESEKIRESEKERKIIEYAKLSGLATGISLMLYGANSLKDGDIGIGMTGIAAGGLITYAFRDYLINKGFEIKNRFEDLGHHTKEYISNAFSKNRGKNGGSMKSYKI